jgi:hypothetical protein
LRTRSHSHPKLSLIAFLLAALSLVVGFTPSVSAQGSQGPLLATQFFAAIGGEVTAYQLSADAVLHTPEGDFTGQAGLTQFGEELDASFADLAFTTDSVAQAGELVIITFTLTGINTGALQGLDANCALVAVPAVAMLHVTEQAMSHDPLGAYLVVTIDTIVTEQWISYDRDLLAGQGADFNAFDPSTRPGCADRGMAATPVS